MSKLLNGSFQFAEIPEVKRLTTKRPIFTHPFTLAALYGSMGVCDVMVKYDVDVFVLEKEEFNVFHCLVCIAFYQPHNEETIAQSYIRLCRIIGAENVETLLRMEDTTGLRPLEFAVHQGTLKLMMTIFETPGIYKIREDIIGIRRYRWYDITEYETDDVSLNRYTIRSPVHIVPFLDAKHIYSDAGRRVLTESIIADWIRKSIHSKRFIIVSWFIFKIVYSCAFFVYQLSQTSVANRYIKAVSSEEYNTSDNQHFNDSTECEEDHTIISLTTQRCLEAFLILQSLTTVLHDTLMFMHAFKATSMQFFILKDLSGKRKSIAVDMSSAYQRSSALVFAVMVLVEIAIYNNPTKENITYLVVTHLFQTPIITTSILHHMAIFHSIGHMILYIRRMFSMLFTFIALFGVFLCLFTRLFIMISETESLGGCVSQFSSFFAGVYTSFLIFLNTFEVRDLSVGLQMGFQAVHICFVFVLGVLLFNLLIALFSDEVKMVSENREVVLSIEQLWTVNTIDYLCLNTPIIRSVYIPMKRASTMKNFVCLEGKIFLVSVEVVGGAKMKATT